MLRAPRSRAKPDPLPVGRCPVRLALCISLTALSLATPAIADTDQREEQIFEQARFGRQLWIDVRDRLTGIQLQAEDGADFGAEYDGTDLHWLRSGFAIGGAVPYGSVGRGIAVAFSTAIVNPVTDGSTRFIDLPGTSDDPFDPLLDSALGFGGRLDLWYGFDLETNAGLSARHEIGAEFVSALATGGSVALGFRYQDWLRLRLGVGLGTAIEHADLTVSPVFRLRVRPMPDVWVETDGTSGRIEWAVNPRLDLSLFGGVDSKRYRLASRGRIVGAGSLELRKSEVGVGIRTRLGRSWRVRVQAAVVLGQHLSVFDDHRDLVDARDTREPSGALRFRIEWQAPRPAE